MKDCHRTLDSLMGTDIGQHCPACGHHPLAHSNRCQICLLEGLAEALVAREAELEGATILLRAATSYIEHTARRRGW